VRRALLAAFALALLALPARAAAVGLQPIGTFNSPIYITAPTGDPRLFVVERGGTIQVLHDGARTQFLDIHTMVDTTGERGLLSMAFDPSYASNGLFYVFFNDNGTAGATAGDIHIDEFHVSSNPNVADAASRRPVMTIGHSSASNHNGGQLQFGSDGLLYVSVGEAGNGANAQTLSNALGKVLRIDPHGSGPGAHGIPPSNPFVGTPGATQEIWSLGLRNPFRFSFDHATGDLVIGDVGAGSREEVDYSPATSGGGRGANYGWPNCEGFSGFPASCPGSTPPVFDYGHTSPGGGLPSACAIIGGFVYRGAQMPELAGRYLYTDLCTGQLGSIQLGLPLASGDRAEGPLMSSPHSFGQDSSCELYVTNGNVVDKIVGSLSGSAPPGCQGGSATRAKSCRHHRKRRNKAAASAKKRKKLCVRGIWASRL
jgi:glucose/arabinose dehydrogenase